MGERVGTDFIVRWMREIAAGDRVGEERLAAHAARRR